MINRKVISVSMNEEEYELYKKSKKYISDQFLNRKINNSQFLKYILTDFYYDLNEIKKMESQNKKGIIKNGSKKN